MLIHLERMRGLGTGQRLAPRRAGLLSWLPSLLLSWLLSSRLSLRLSLLLSSRLSSRRLPLLALLLAGVAMNAHSAPKPVRVLVLGDSLSAEYGLSRGSGWVALLEQGLKAQKIDAGIVNASISGETSSGGRTRLPALLAQYHPDIVVIELGANDGLRGLPVAAAEDNFRTMMTQARSAGARVLLIGMHLPPNYGRDYGARFFAMYGKLAREFHAPLVPFMLEGVADTAFQADRLHPTADAHPTILGNIWPRLLPLIKSP